MEQETSDNGNSMSKKNENINKETEFFLRNIDFQSSVKKYEFEWREISQYLLPNNLKELRKIAIKGNLKTSKFRSICWSLFFGLLNVESSESWPTERIAQRKRYTALKEKYCLNPHFGHNKNDDPLSQNDNSLWNQHFCDQELCAVIKQDVVRTFPGIEFFRKSYIQEIMISILFCYARENPAMCYRQGMHEILAPILFVIHSDHQAFLHFQQLNSKFEDPILGEILDARKLEEDSFLLFSHIMSVIESYYRINDLIPTSTGYFPSSPNMTLTPEEITNANRLNEVEIADQLNIIRDQILVKQDFNLHNHLLQLDIPLAIFGIRWLRLLFGREFPLQDLLILWDAIFAEDNNFLLTNYIVVAMLISIREKLLSSDYTSCLTILMKFPNTVEISHVIKLALHIKSPHHYPNPNTENVTNSLSVDNKYSTLPKNFTPRHSIAAPQRSPSKSADTTNQRRGSANFDQHRLLENKRASIARVNGIHTLTARAAIQVAAKQNVGETELGIIDGYLENDPEVSILTLQHAQSIMAISRFKLIQYLAVIRKNLAENQNVAVQNALDGIEEVCSLLKNTYSTPGPSILKNIVPPPVDLAFEANELAAEQQQKQLQNAAAAAAVANQTKIKKQNLSLELQQPLTVPSQVVVVRPSESNRGDVQIPKAKPMDSANYTSFSTSNSSYEIPENNRIANQYFGNVREIPMKIFKSATSAESKMNLDESIATMPLIDPTLERDISFDYDN